MRVDEDTWADFKQAIGDHSVAEVLGRYVETEVTRAQRDTVKHGGVTERELVDALERAEALTATLQEVTGRLRGLRGIWT